ncbi:WecB/TagA/CpsF family glycosyltransferase [Bacillus sp. ISL-55]|nr:WecB/TagA/CpsF family glycosyltransferase [Bacillus sp. ISL-55]MBT2693699.1 WecB/TagA/CpsF family glycosyltransferase [Bacillus sp. ISL-55]
MTMNKINILNMRFDSLLAKELVGKLSNRVAQSEKTFVVTANPEIVMYGEKDERYLDVVNQADYVIPDGYGVILGSRILGRPLPERIPGFDLMNELLKSGNDKGWKVYLLGAKNEVVSKAVENIKMKYPQLEIVGWHDGYFDWETNEITEEIIGLEPDLVFVALGFPKQEMWISENLPSFSKGLFMGVGGSFDVWAGTVKRAPEIWQRLNLEWFYRLIQQPSRWKRMLVLPLFVLKVISKKLGSNKQ